MGRRKRAADSEPEDRSQHESLAPDITEAILGGRHPIDVTLDRILKLSPLALDWPTQRRALGVTAR